MRELEKRFPNRAAAAKAAGVAKSTFQNWVEGKADPSFQGLARFAAEVGVSLDWIAYGNEPRDRPHGDTETGPDGGCLAGDPNGEILRQVVLAIEHELAARNKNVSAETKSLLIQEVYIHMREYEARGTPDPKADRALADWIRRMVTVAS